MTAPRWLLRQLGKFGLEMRTPIDHANATIAREALAQFAVMARDREASAALARDAERRADEAERKLVRLAALLRDAIAVLRGRVDLPDDFAVRLTAGSAPDPMVPRRTGEPADVAPVARAA